MQKRFLTPVLMVIVLLLVVVPAALAGAPLLDRPAAVAGPAAGPLPAAQAEQPGLVTASLVAQLANQPGRAIVAARGNHLVVDSPPLLDGPNEALNPVDLLLASLASCSTFVYETAAKEMGVPLEQVVATVEADFDPRGVRGEIQPSGDASGVLSVEADHNPDALKVEPIDPRIQAFRVHLAVSGATQAQAEALAEQWRQRCPIYTTLIRAAPIEIDITIAEPMAATAE